MGKISDALAGAAEKFGAEIRTNSSVEEILLTKNGKKAEGVRLKSGETIFADNIVCGCSPHHAFTKLMPFSSKQNENGSIDLKLQGHHKFLFL